MISLTLSQEEERFDVTPNSSQQETQISINHEVDEENTNCQGDELSSKKTIDGNINDDCELIPRKKKMTRLLYLIENKESHKIFTDDSLYYYFLKKCVANVITKSKWKENCVTYDYDQFIHPTDEAFALLVLENNSERYSDMVERPGLSSDEYACPKYTTITRNKDKDSRSQVRGWSDAGKWRLLEFTNIIREMRGDKIWIEGKKKMIKRRCKREYKYHKKRKDTNNDDNETRHKRMNREDRNEWKLFQMNNLKFDNWYTQV